MNEINAPTRRQLFETIGKAGGLVALYQSMTALGHAAETQFDGPPVLSGAKQGSTVVVLGAGLAGMLAAYELTKAGYKVQILEYQTRPGGRNYTLRGGDTHTEIDGSTQKVGFAPRNYLNPGPWRIPHHHRTLLHYCKVLGVALEPFIQLNHNAYIHNTDALDGAPVRYKALATDFKGHVSELLGKSLNQGALDDKVMAEDKERLIDALRNWGVLDKNLSYASSLKVSGQRGYDMPPGGGVTGAPTASNINSLHDVLDSKVWNTMSFYFTYVMQTTMFQPVGGMDMIGKAFAREVGHMVTYNARVSKIAQNDKGVEITYADNTTGVVGTAKADWCVCTIPLSVLGQLDVQVSDAKIAAIKAVPYSGMVKTGLEFKRRFWEEDESIYGGHSFTNQPISLISYPNFDFFKKSPAVLLGAFASGPSAYQFAGMTPEQRVEASLAQGERIHPQYRQEFMNGTSVAWSRVPWTLGCCAQWSEGARKQHYQNLVSMDGRVVLAGEHASYYGCWMEGAMLSSIDAITRLHKRALEA